MKNEINIDLINEDNFFEKYNRKQISKELIDYMINEAESLPRNNKDITININNYLNINNIEVNIRKKLSEEYNKTLIKYEHNFLIQIVYLIIGIIALFVSTLISDSIFKEIVLIGGWVLIWYMVELEIFSDMELRKRRKIIKKLLASTIKITEL